MEGIQSAPGPSSSPGAPSAPSSSGAPGSSPGSQPGQNGGQSWNGQNQGQRAPKEQYQGESRNDPLSRPESERSRPQEAREEIRRDEAEAEESREAARRWKLKASDREWDLGEEEMVSYAQKGIDADKKWQDAARIREQNQQFLRALIDNPEEILTNPMLQKRGFDFEKIAMDYLAKKAELEFMDPDKREAMEWKQKAESYEERENKAREQRLEQQQRDEDVRYQRQVDTEVRSGLESAGLPVVEWTYDSVIKYMQRAMAAGYKDVTPESVLPYVKRDWQRNQAQMAKLPPERVLDLFGDEAINVIQQAVIQRAKGKGSSPAPQAPQRTSDEIREPVKKMTDDEWRRDLHRKMNTGLY